MNVAPNDYRALDLSEDERIRLFKEVKDGLETKQSLGYENSVKSLNACLYHITTEPVRVFLRECFIQMVTILTDQVPSKMGNYEKNCVEDSLGLSIMILLKLLPDDPTAHFNVLIRIFDKNVSYYAGSKTYWTSFPGNHHTRIFCIKRFAENNGFPYVLQAIKNPDLTWLGAETLFIFVRALLDADRDVDQSLAGEILEEVMRQILRLSEDQIKKESTETFANLIRAILSRRDRERQINFNAFWLEHTLKVMNSNSIVLKLFAWDQVHEIIREAVYSRPPPLRYLVRNAGNDAVNGIYNCAFQVGETPRYTKEIIGSDGRPHTLTLFRCAMRSKQKWWFISEADMKCPGTDKDIDYYQHKSQPDQEKEPPSFGWITVVNNNVQAHGIEPPPVLVRQDYLLPEGSTIDIFLIAQLQNWALKNNLVSQVFGTSIHRELISRSSKLLYLLAEADLITGSHLRLIWKAGCQSHEIEVIDEINSLLASLSQYLSDDLFAELISLVLETLAQLEEASTGGGTHSNILKASQFVEKLLHEGIKYVRTLSTKSFHELLRLLWTLYKNPAIENVKCASAIEELFSLCLHEKRAQNLVLPKILECLNMISTVQPQAAVQSLPTPCPQSSRCINILHFFVTLHSNSDIIDSLYSSSSFLTVLMLEIEGFVQASRTKRFTSEADEETHRKQISIRLSILRHFYGLSHQVKMPMKQLQTLSAMLTHPIEREEFFLFLRSAGIKQQVQLEAAYDIPQCREVFTQIICDPEVDWSASGLGSFQCFQTYFSGLQSPVMSVKNAELLPVVGLETLWRLTLSIPSAAVAKEAVALLLKSYETYSSHSPETFNQLLAQIFAKVDNAVHESNSGAISAKTMSELSRCMEILQGAVSRSKWSGSSFCHSVRGCIGRIKVVVKYRKIIPNIYYASSYDTRSSVISEKPSEGVLTVDVHPMHTLLLLKQKIASELDFGFPKKISVEKNGLYLADNLSTLASLGILDGAEISATLAYPTNATVGLHSDDDVDYRTSGVTSISSSSSVDVGDLIISQSKYFESLLTLLEAQEIGNLELSRLVWDLINQIPTQPEMLTTIQNAMRGSPLSDWKDILNASSSSRATYNLQIIDALLQPAPELQNETNLSDNNLFKQSFISTGGFASVLAFFVSVPSAGSRLDRISLSIALHILHFCLFSTFDTGTGDSVSIGGSTDGSSVGRDSSYQTAPLSLLDQVHSNSSSVIEKLLEVANHAAAEEDSDVVSDALVTISYLIKSADVASQLTSNDHAKTLLSVVLRSSSKRVREMAAQFAVQVGRSQPVVFDWLLSELTSIDQGYNYDEIFSALNQLIALNSKPGGGISLDYSTLAQVLSANLIAATSQKLVDGETDRMLVGCLQLLKTLIDLDVKALFDTPLGQNLVPIFMSDFLFAMPSPDKDKTSVCDTIELRQAAFGVLVSMLKRSPESFRQILSYLTDLSDFAASQMTHIWGLTVSLDVKKSNTDYIGLKNQGCTCYLNSLLQQLFMSTSFREAVLRTPIQDTHRTSLWHKDSRELVGLELLFEWSSGSWHKGKIEAYDEDSKCHTVVYVGLDGHSTNDDRVVLNIREGRFQKETGRVKFLPLEGEEGMSERDESAERVLEQLQRTFCFMKASKRRYFDPKPFVEACKNLNLNYNVYHQNDASEFCDNLLDRLETAMKGKHTKQDIWKNVVEKKIFGGKMLYQKIPQDCEVYQSDKRGCGHWQSSRQESFLKVELMIRNKDKIEDSLDELVEGELMDGDNKIMCDVCNEKKSTIRRTCFGVLPNLLILHLKRFDLDFQTFETVKLNNRIAFPVSINMLKYSREGMEAEERRQAKRESNGSADPTSPTSRPKGAGGGDISVQYEDGTDETEPDPLDFQYELQGVLVHSGVAQGGHYYSFIRDKLNKEKWYRFDDEDVTPFSPDQIPYQCYGGSVMTTIAGVSTMVEEDRSANALMLFFDKVRPIEIREEPVEATADRTSSTTSTTTATVPDGVAERVEGVSDLKLVDGCQAFEQEVWESNRRHIVTTYLLDPDLHGFVRSMLQSALKEHPEEQTAEGGSDTSQLMVEFGCHFLLDVVLHCRERTGMRAWLNALKETFQAFPRTAVWFIDRILRTSTCSWLKDYILICTDTLAKSAFVQLLLSATTAIVPNHVDGLREFSNMTGTDLLSLVSANNGTSSHQPDDVSALAYRGALSYQLLQTVTGLLPDAMIYSRTSDELFLLLRDLAALPCMCTVMVESDLVAKLAYFSVPEIASDAVKTLYSNVILPRNLEHGQMLQGVYEAIAALVGVPQSRKVSLLEEQPNLWEPELTAEAKDALTVIFNESSRGGSMDARDLMQYWDRIYGNAQKVSMLTVRSMLDRYDTNTEGRLTLEGFLRRYADAAVYNPKSVWQDLSYFGFQNDLTRAGGLTQAAVVLGSSNPSPPLPTDGSRRLHLPEGSSQCLGGLNFYEAGLEVAEAATVAIAKRVSMSDEKVSGQLLKQALYLLHRTVKDWAWNPNLDTIIGFIRVLMGVQDEYTVSRIGHLLLGEAGLLQVLLQESRNPSTNTRGYNDYDSTRSLSSRYIEFVQDFYQSNSDIASWIDEGSLTNADLRWLKQLIQPPPPQSRLPTSEDEAEMRRAVLTVEGAGLIEVNGPYMFSRMFDNAAMFTKTFINLHKKQSVVFNLYRCRMNDNSHRWYISITPEGKEPGTASDQDFYSAVGTYDRMQPILSERMPPKLGWSKCKGDHSLEPAPRIEWVIAGTHDLSPAASDDRDDTMAVAEDDVNDDSLSSLPSTPIGDSFDESLMNDTTFSSL